MTKICLNMLFFVIIYCFFSTISYANDFYVISVQNKCGSCKGTRSAGGRWCDNGDGTITDMTTCLVWLKYADWGGQKPWRNSETDCDPPNYKCYDDAHQRAGNLANGEPISTSGETIYLTDSSVVGDWRLPTKTELWHMSHEGGETIQYLSSYFFEGIQFGMLYWTCTTYEYHPAIAYCVDMYTNCCTYLTSKNYIAYVWPVRDPK